MTHIIQIWVPTMPKINVIYIFTNTKVIFLSNIFCFYSDNIIGNLPILCSPREHAGSALAD